MPHFSDELCSADTSKRLEAVRLLGRLFGQRGGAAMAAEWEYVLLELLKRFKDEKVGAKRLPSFGGIGVDVPCCCLGMPFFWISTA